MATGKLVNILNHQVCFMEYSDSAFFSYTPQQIFDVVADIEKYPAFLPGWISAAIVERRGNTVKVEQELGFAFLNWRFTSEAVFEPPFHLYITSHKGPFLSLDLDWALCPVEGDKTRVSIVVKIDNASALQHRFLHGIFSNSTRTLLDYFKKRVAQVNSSSKMVTSKA